LNLDLDIGNLNFELLIEKLQYEFALDLDIENLNIELAFGKLEFEICT
jgi:hypothetical protein